MIKDIIEFLEERVNYYNKPEFIEHDPISIPHQFEIKEDIEISSFLTCTIAWGNRKMIMRNANKLMQLMDNSPYDFMLNSTDNDLTKLDNFVHRTFNSYDCIYFIKSLKNIYINHGGLEKCFTDGYNLHQDMKMAIVHFRNIFLEKTFEARVQRHISDPMKNSAAKRLNLFLRWMVRNDNKGVDFGLWDDIPVSKLYIPLDVHCASNARLWNLLVRKQNDWKAVEELTTNLSKFDVDDPVKYDFALYGEGAIKNLS